MLLTVDKEPLAKGEFTSSREREADYKMQSILHAPSITPDECEELNTKKKAGNTNNEENAIWSNHYYTWPLALEELTEEAMNPFMYNTDPL